MLYSTDLKKYPKKLPHAIREAIFEIKQMIGYEELEVLSYNDFNVVIPVTIDVNLPS